MEEITGLIGERYEIKGKIGDGGMSVVYRVLDTRLAVDVAIKFIDLDNFSPKEIPAMRARFTTEARLMARLTHPNIVKVTDYGEHHGIPYLVMELLEGGSLADLMNSPVPYGDAARLLAPVASALHYIHSKDMIHRDVKPSNILLTPSGEPKISDFGIVKVLRADPSQDSSMTSTGTTIGTPHYMAPEQFHGEPLYSSDQYALGTIFYEMVTGRQPFGNAKTPQALMLLKTTQLPPTPRYYMNNLPNFVEAVIMRTLRIDPRERYGSMGELAEVLKNLAAVQQKDETLTHIDIPLPNPRSFPAWLLAVLIPLLLVSIGGAVWIITHLETSAQNNPTVQPPDSSPVAALNIETSPGVVQSSTITPTNTQFAPTNTSVLLSTDPPPAPTSAAAVWPTDQMKMVQVPPGEFWMGLSDEQRRQILAICPDCPASLMADQTPQRKIYLDAFWIDQTEVTIKQFSKFVASTGYRTTAENSGESWVLVPGGGDFKQVKGANWLNPTGQNRITDVNSPQAVTQISWQDANAYCQWTGRRLPTEAEWEKAARGPSGYLFPWGNTSPDYTKANFDAVQDGPVAVGSFTAGDSPYGAKDMAGNIMEWTAGYYQENYYQLMPAQNPKGADSGSGYPLRGGSWATRVNKELYWLTTTYRWWNTPDTHSNILGFRCASSQAGSLQPDMEKKPQYTEFQVCSSKCDGSNKVASYPGGTKTIYLQWQYKNIPTGAHYIRQWTMDGQEWVKYDCTWPGPSSGVDNITLSEPDGLHSGTWMVTITVNGTVLLQEQVRVTGNHTYWHPAGTFTSCYGKK